MKCAHPMCNRGLGLVSHRGWFGYRLYMAEPRKPLSPRAPYAGLFAPLFALPNAHGIQLQRSPSA